MPHRARLALLLAFLLILPWLAPAPRPAAAEEPDPGARPAPARRARRGRKLPAGVKRIADLEYARVGGHALRLDLYLPEKAATPPPLIVWVHGGGWRAGSKANCKLTWMVPEGYAVASVGYRLTQVATFPAQIHDVKGAVRWLRAHAARLGFDATRVGIAGSSAGGHLAALMGTSGGDPALEGTVGGNAKQSSRVQAVYDLFGPSDMATILGERRIGARAAGGAVTKLLGGTVEEKPEVARQASPTSFVTADDPPFLIAHGAKDRLVPLQQSQKLDQLLDAAKVESELVVLERAAHGGPAFEDAALRGKVSAFFRQHLHRAPPTTPSTASAPVLPGYAKAGPHAFAQAKFALTDTTRGKQVPVRVTYPTGKGAFPVLLWSHGMFGSRTTYDPLVSHWASRGYVVVQPTHSDSLSLPRRERAQGFADWANRPADATFVLDQLATFARRLPKLTGTLDTSRIGMGGHSYGAMTTMLSGGTTPVGATEAAHADPRPKALFVLSGQGVGGILEPASWRTLTRPTFVVTGTRDTGRNGQPFTWRTEPYTHAPKGDKYLAILQGADHGFGGIAGGRGGLLRRRSNPDDVATIKGLSTLFFDAYVRGDAQARANLTPAKLAAPSRGALRMLAK